MIQNVRSARKNKQKIFCYVLKKGERPDEDPEKKTL